MRPAKLVDMAKYLWTSNHDWIVAMLSMPVLLCFACEDGKQQHKVSITVRVACRQGTGFDAASQIPEGSGNVLAYEINGRLVQLQSGLT